MMKKWIGILTLFTIPIFFLSGCSVSSDDKISSEENGAQAIQAFNKDLINHQLLFLGEEKNAGHAIALGGKATDGFIAITAGQNGDRLLKYTIDGQLLWGKELAEIVQDYSVQRIVACEDGFMLVCVRNSNETSENLHALAPKIVKLDSTGNRLWEKIYENFSWTLIKNVFSIGSEVITIGHTEDGNRLYLSKLDDSGRFIAEKYYDMDNGRFFYSDYIENVGIAVLMNFPSGNGAFVSGHADHQGVLAVFDASLELRWHQSFAQSFTSIHQLGDSENELYLICADERAGQILYKYDWQGNQLLAKAMDEPIQDIAGQVDGQLILCNETNMFIYNRNGDFIKKIPFSSYINEIIASDTCVYILSTSYEPQKSDADGKFHQANAPVVQIKERIYHAFDANWNKLWEDKFTVTK